MPSPLQEIADERLTASGVRLYLKRDDLIHPDLPGNKWRKLRHNLDAARAGNHRRLLTFGGAFSNHLRAVAAAGQHFGFDTIGVVRGEEHLPLNPSLAYARTAGMTLTYLDRSAYRRKHSEEVLMPLREKFGPFYLVPEGGTNELGVRGCVEIAGEIDVPFDVICCAVGTGGTLAGIAAGLDADQRAVGFSVLKGGQFLTSEVEYLQEQTFGERRGHWRVETAYHFGGFARSTSELKAFVAEFQERHGVLLDWVYVAKMLFGFSDLVEQGELDDTTVVAVVSGPAWGDDRD